MSDEEFNRLLRGPLYHPLPMFIISRLALALRAVVDATGEVGEEALRAHCTARQLHDENQDSEEQEEDGS